MASRPRPLDRVFARRRLALGLLTGALLLVAAPATTTAASKAEIYARCAPATVLLIVTGGGGVQIGAGAIVEPSGLVVTNRHVIEAAERGGRIAAFLYDPAERTIDDDLRAWVQAHAKAALQPVILGTDPTLDLALLRLPARSKPYPTVAFGDSNQVVTGQDVLAIGHPQGLAWTLTAGTISAVRPMALQTDAAINPGNSGGPLLDLEGKVVGINTWIRKDAQALGFARPSALVQAFVLRARQPRQVAEGAGKQAIPVGPAAKSARSALTRAVMDTIVARAGELGAFDGREALFSVGGQIFIGARERLLEGPVRAAWLEEAVRRAHDQAQDADARREVLIAADTNLPRAVREHDGRLFLRAGLRYHDVGPSRAAAVDDHDGGIISANAEGRVHRYDPETGHWSPTALGRIAAMASSEGTVYAMVETGYLVALQGEEVRTLHDAPIRATMAATGGWLYVLRRDGKLFRRHPRTGWDQRGRPIATGVAQYAALGAAWYGLDSKGRLWSGQVRRYIETRFKIRELLPSDAGVFALAEDFTVHHWDAASEQWRN
ncbi:MAG: trypsin-like peptidase domain-containing protein [Deltaproteobacteria bacterium]|nr:trypsin-like peptidase domain-containing protein [Deltaproteobacteria bacterium]